MPDICIRLAQPADCAQLARLREALWPESSVEEHAREVAPILDGTACLTMPIIILVAETTHQSLIGFLEAELRSHADGCNASRPVGYIEGWYVAEKPPRRGMGSELMSAAEEWARSQGCAEMHPTPGSIMRFRNAFTRHWGTRSSTAVCIAGRRSEKRRTANLNLIIFRPCVPFASPVYHAPGG